METTVGKEEGRITLLNTCTREAPNDLATFTKFGSTLQKLLYTTRVVIITVIDNVVTTIAVKPAPNITIKIGPSATFGILLKTTI
ncbi:hypothetical protein D3C75_1255390 [compost metagenome]